MSHHNRPWRPNRPHYDTVGVTAARSADCMERNGFNTFSSMDPDSNEWGAWPSDYSPASVAAALNRLAGGSGYNPLIREYHYASHVAEIQSVWCPDVAQRTGAKISVSIGAHGSPLDDPDGSLAAADLDAMMNDAKSLISLARASEAGTKWLKWVEGVNEPNNDFGNGSVPAANALLVQQELFRLAQGISGRSFSVVGPSAVFGLPFPSGWLGDPDGYWKGGLLDALKAASELANAHIYPPYAINTDDGSGLGTLQDIVNAFTATFAQRNIITEWHPTLFNNFTPDGINYPRRLDPVYDAYYAPCFMLSVFRQKFEAWFWYSLFDYRDTYLSGLFPRTSDQDPRPVANTMRAMYQLLPDLGANKRTFTPAKLNYTIDGLGPNGKSFLFQVSSGVFGLYVLNEGEEPEGDEQPITVRFLSHAMRNVKRYKISDASSPEAPMALRQDQSLVQALPFGLNNSVHLLVINY